MKINVKLCTKRGGATHVLFAPLMKIPDRGESGVDNSPNQSDPNPNFEDMEKNF